MLLRIEDPNEYSLHTGLDTFYCISVPLRDASNTIKIVNDAFPMERFCHLKRIRKVNGEDHVKVLLHRTIDGSDDLTLREKLQQLGLPESSLEEVQVPTRHPITKAQYEKWNAIWPLNFHESTYERLKIAENDHFTKLYQYWRPYITENDLSLLIAENLFPADKNDSESLVIFESSRKDFECPKEGTKYPFDHLVLRTINENPAHCRTERNGKIPYLLSGCVAFLSNEPCTMCAMCLLHSRIDCVVYSNSQECGALGSICLLHCNEGLNHRFPVYKYNL